MANVHYYFGAAVFNSLKTAWLFYASDKFWDFWLEFELLLFADDFDDFVD